MIILLRMQWMWRVAVSVGNLETGVVCRVDGIPALGGTIRLMPGSHECIYSKPDYIEQSLPFLVEPGTQCSLPRPYTWRETDGLATLVSAEVALERGDWRLAESLLPSAMVNGDVALKRKRNLEERIERYRKYLRRIDAAAAAFMDAHWMDVLKIYSGLLEDGYALTSEDTSRIRTAIENAEVSLEMRQRQAGSGTVGNKSKDVDAGLLAEMRKQLQSSLKAGKGPGGNGH